MENQSQAATIFGVIIALLLIGTGAYFITHHTAAPSPSPITDATSTFSAPTSTVIKIDPKATSTIVGNYTITPVRGSAVKIPALDRPIPETPKLTAEVRAKLVENINAVSAFLKKDPTSGQDWMNLGVYRQTVGDFEGARQAWDFVAKGTHAGAAYENLGNLYALHLNKLTLAESNYKLAIAADPSNEGFYLTLSDFFSAQNRGASVETTLKAGIKAIPKAYDLQVLLARYYKSAGRTADAKTTYDAAAANATAQGRTDIATSIQQESAGL